MIAKPNYKGAFVFENSDLVSVNMGKSTVCLNKPIYLGQTILDLSKVMMYEFHYEYVKPKFGESVRLLFTDTDSLCYEIKTKDFYEDIKDDVSELFDTSNYPENHFLYTDKNERVIGKMKDEAKGKIITEFVGLRSKLYSYKVENKDVTLKCKGVGKSAARNCITFEDYRDCLFDNETYQVEFNTIRSRKHDITTDRVTKIALSANDDKRYVIPDDPNHGTLALGHHKIP